MLDQDSHLVRLRQTAELDAITLRAHAEDAEAVVRWIDRRMPEIPTAEPTGTPKAATQDGKPTGTAAIRLLLQEDPEKEWSAAQLHEVMAERGWLLPGARNPRRGIEAVIARLHREGEIERPHPGRYRGVTLTSPS